VKFLMSVVSLAVVHDWLISIELKTETTRSAASYEFDLAVYGVVSTDYSSRMTVHVTYVQFRMFLHS
jgi:hypothetical protein